MKTSHLSARSVLGYSRRISHATASDDIGPLWAKVGASDLLRGQSRAVAVYHDYTLQPGGYEVTVTVGREVDADEAVPYGLTRVDVPDQACAVWTTDGSVEEVVAAWGEVWEQWPDGGPRSFAADVEVWEQGPDGKPRAAQVYVGVRS
ncbi:MAG: effector binding domain-containing protein [Myxococcota bacterium]